MPRTCAQDCRGSCQICPFLPELMGEKPVAQTDDRWAFEHEMGLKEEHDYCSECEGTRDACAWCTHWARPDLPEIEWRAAVHLMDGKIEYFNADDMEMAEELCSMAWRGDFMSRWLIDHTDVQVNCSIHGWQSTDLAGMCDKCREQEDDAELDAYESAEANGLVDGSEYDQDKIPF